MFKRKMKKLFTAPWYPWYVESIQHSDRVALMSLTEEGAYRRALDYEWEKGSIPADPKLCAIRIGKKCTEKIAAKVQQMFEPMKDDSTRLVNPTLEAIRAEQERKYKTKSALGKKGAATRWKQKGSDDSSANSYGIATAKQTDAYIEREIENKEKEIREEGATPQRLESVFDNPAVVLYQEKFGVNVSKAFASEIVENVRDLSLWKRLISEKISFASGPVADRQKICKWFLAAYLERIDKQKAEAPKVERLPTHAEKMAEAEAQNARMILPPKAVVVESVQ